jgi:PTS system N-acetylglucosamine-specific IIC component
LPVTKPTVMTVNVNSNAGKDENETTTLARRYVGAIGGSDNLTGIDACITRLRLNVKDSALVNDALAKRLGASGVIPSEQAERASDRRHPC